MGSRVDAVVRGDPVVAHTDEFLDIDDVILESILKGGDRCLDEIEALLAEIVSG